MTEHFVQFEVNKQRYALPIREVATVLPALEIISLPQAPEWIQGLINVGGAIIPVVNFRKRFHLPAKPLALADRIIVLEGTTRSLALVVDDVKGVVEFPLEEVSEARSIYPRLNEYLDGVGCFNDDTVLIFDISRLFGIEELRIIDNIMAPHA